MDGEHAQMTQECFIAAFLDNHYQEEGRVYAQERWIRREAQSGDNHDPKRRCGPHTAVRPCPFVNLC